MHQRLADDLARLPELMRHAQERALQVLDALDDRATAQAPAPVASKLLPQNGEGEPLPSDRPQTFGTRRLALEHLRLQPIAGGPECAHTDLH